MDGTLLLVVQAIEVIASILVIAWAVHEIKMANQELRDLKKGVTTVRNDLNTECSMREAADLQLKKALQMVVKSLNKLQGRVERLEKRK